MLKELDLAQYVEQTDTHLPFLTVRETAAFVHDNACVAPDADADEAAKKLHAEKVDAVTNLLALEGCIDTIIGDDLVRGVSGGEKKRVTIGEALVTNARLLCCDEISTGLDAAVTFNIVAALRAWARKTNGTAVVALLQPTPEVFDTFDTLVLLREGATAYHGPREGAAAYFRKLGFAPPAEGSGEDVADWFVNLVATPAKALAKGSSLNLSAMSSANAPTTTKALAAAWRASTERAKTRAEAKDPTPLTLATPFARAQYGLAFPHGAWAGYPSSGHAAAASVVLPVAPDNGVEGVLAITGMVGVLAGPLLACYATFYALRRRSLLRGGAPTSQPAAQQEEVHYVRMSEPPAAGK